MNRRRFLGALGVGAFGLFEAVGNDVPALVGGHPRARGDPISVEHIVEDPDLEYDPSSDSVRYATVKSGEEVVRSTTEPFETYANRRCASVGSEVVLPTVRERFDRDLEGLGKGVSGEVFRLVITVMHVTTHDRDGEVITEPNFAFEELVERAPRTVTVTLTLDGRSHRRSVPVFAERSEMWNL